MVWANGRVSKATAASQAQHTAKLPLTHTSLPFLSLPGGMDIAVDLLGGEDFPLRVAGTAHPPAAATAAARLPPPPPPFNKAALSKLAATAAIHTAALANLTRVGNGLGASLGIMQGNAAAARSAQAAAAASKSTPAAKAQAPFDRWANPATTTTAAAATKPPASTIKQAVKAASAAAPQAKAAAASSQLAKRPKSNATMLATMAAAGRKKQRQKRR